MRIIVVKDKKQMGVRAAQLIAAEMKKKHFVLGLATGSTPIPLYQELIRANKAGELDFATVITFNLDEYVGLPATHDQSYRYFMNQELFDHINIDKKNTHVPNGMAKDIDGECDEYEATIDDVGGIDYQVLGIGSNGHIGFNEPGSSLGSLTRIKTLTLKTRQDNARFFKSLDEVPKYAITMGIGSVMKAQKVVLMANGANKADAVKAALEGPVMAMCPASALQLHRFATYIVTEDAASKLTLPVER
ncbi:MAG: glucosamine-6-phosphate deaminase [Planctomycetes bacterium]|nr:glucosamine-6-phosphate deaminase [Planctomycetota bacterium]MBM4085369.1 glucosamine-6-phosphate deaminase [Planctomycetota bacterium]